MKSLVITYFASFLVLGAATPVAIANPMREGLLNLTQSSEPSVDARSSGIRGMQYCGVFANADGGMASQLVNKLGQGSLKSRGYSVAAHGCNRVQCWDTSAVYVCNVRT